MEGSLQFKNENTADEVPSFLRLFSMYLGPLIKTGVCMKGIEAREFKFS